MLKNFKIYDNDAQYLKVRFYRGYEDTNVYVVSNDEKNNNTLAQKTVLSDI